jgi:uncharacterized repeat protein (TIGR01451 family)
LVTFFDSTGGNAWLHRDGWLTSTTPCSWYGITCENGHVTRLVLPANELEGLLPNGLSALSELRQLILAGGVLTSTNHLAGSIPPELGSLDSLQALDLSRNQLSGSLPAALGSLSSLQALNVAGNHLSGALPLELTALTVTMLRFEETDLCIPDDPAMQAWLSIIATLGSTGTVCQLVLTHTAEAPALTGGSLTYHLSVENLHASTTGTRIALRDTLPAGVTVVSTTPPASQQGSLLTWAIGSLAPGARYDATLVVSVPATPVRLTNKATAEGQLGSYQVVQTSYVGDVLPWADFDGDRRVTESDIQMIGWCWQQPTAGICRLEYHVDPDGDTDIVDIMWAAATY